MKDIKSYFLFSKEQRRGILLLLLLIVVLQTSSFFYGFTKDSIERQSISEKQWMEVQKEMNNLKLQATEKKYEIKAFNPNFITDYKGYKLGMSVHEIDRLLEFRKKGKYVNSPNEFQNVTKVSDSLLDKLKPLFKFPDWVTDKKQYKSNKNYSNNVFAKKEKKVVIDINQATQDDLIKIYGIGEVISLRILKQKERLGGFVSMEQMKDIWGLSPEVIGNLETHFKVLVLPKPKKIDINNASLKELSQFPYFNYQLAKQIVTYRSMDGEIKNSEDLTKIIGLSIDKASIIALYLDF